MIRICLLGSDSTHVEAFASRLHSTEGPLSGKAQVVCLWGENFSEAQEKAQKLGIQRVENNLEAALIGVDLAMVVGRFGNSHFLPARMALEKKIPVFVDKPFTLSASEARELGELSHKMATPLCTSSPLRFCKEMDTLLEKKQRTESRSLFLSTSAPATCIDLGPDPRFDSPFFYGIHSAEMLCELAGEIPLSWKVECGRTSISTQVEFPSVTGNLMLIRALPEIYTLGLATTAGYETHDVSLDGSYYIAQLRFLLDEFLPRKRTITLDGSIRIIEMLADIEEKDALYRRENL